jgi:hypothetical protein
MKKTYLTITPQNSTYLIQTIFLLFLVIFLTVSSPFCSWQGLRYDLFGSMVFFVFFNRYHYSLVLTIFFSFYIDTVMVTPIGSTGIFVLLMWYLSQAAQVLLKKRNFLVHWLAFGLVYFLSTIFKLFMLNFLFHLTYNIFTELYSFVLTLCVYPILCCSLIKIFYYFNVNPR